MSLLKRIVASPAFLSAAGSVAANYLRLVWYSSRRTLEPSNFYETFETPAIVAMWHGQHFLTPFIKRAGARYRAKVIISRHRDGELNARAAEKLGYKNVKHMSAGLSGWNKAGEKTEKAN